MEKAELIKQREGLPDELGQDLSTRVERFFPVMFSRAADTALLAFSRDVFKGMDLRAMTSYERPRKPPVLLQAYRAFSGAGFFPEWISFVMGLIEMVLADYVAGVAQKERSERTKFLFPFEEALITETVLSRIGAVVDDVLVKKFSEIFGLREGLVASNLARIKEAVVSGEGRTVGKVVQEVRALVRKNFSKEVANEGEARRDREERVYGLIGDDERCVLARKFQPKSFETKEKKGGKGRDFFQEQIVWVYTVLKMVPPEKEKEAKKKLAELFGCHVNSIERLTRFFDKGKEELPERLYVQLFRVKMEVKAVEEKRNPVLKIEDLSRENLIERVYEKIVDEKHRRLVRLLEPGERSLVLERKWVLAIFAASEEASRSEQALLLSRVFKCNPNAVRSLLRAFRDDERFSGGAVKQDLKDVREFLTQGATTGDVDGGKWQEEWGGFLKKGGISLGKRGSVLAFGLKEEDLIGEVFTHIDRGASSSEMMIGGIRKAGQVLKGAMARSFVKVSGISTNGSMEDFFKIRPGQPVGAATMNLEGDAVQKRGEVSDFFAGISLAERAAIRIGFSGWSQAEVRDFLAGDGGLKRLKPALNKGDHSYNIWESSVREYVLGDAKKVPLPFLIGINPRDPDLFSGVSLPPLLYAPGNREFFAKYRLASGAVLSLVEKELVYLLTAHVDREYASQIQKFLKALEQGIDRLNENCVRDFFGGNLVSEFKRGGNWKKEGEDCCAMIVLENGKINPDRENILKFVSLAAADLAKAYSRSKAPRDVPKVYFINEKGSRLLPGHRVSLKKSDRIVYQREGQEFSLSCGDLTSGIESENPRDRSRNFFEAVFSG